MTTLEMPVENGAISLHSEDQPKYVTTDVAAELLDVTEGRIKQLIAEGKLVGHKPEGRRGWHIDIASIRRYDKYRSAIEDAKKILKGESDGKP
jgi:excisionase family DNA binding protein